MSTYHEGVGEDQERVFRVRLIGYPPIHASFAVHVPPHEEPRHYIWAATRRLIDKRHDDYHLFAGPSITFGAADRLTYTQVEWYCFFNRPDGSDRYYRQEFGVVVEHQRGARTQRLSDEAQRDIEMVKVTPCSGDIIHA